jgi:hypothetical protein
VDSRSDIYSLAVVPTAVEAAVNRALSRNPADRFDTAAEFAVALCGRMEDTWESDTSPPRPPW